MINIVKNFKNIKSSINNSNVNIIAVSKTFTLDKIKPLIDFGHNHFGENKIQEANTKWSKIKNEVPSLILHMIGRLQSNKAKEAVSLFNYIHSVDNSKLASLLSKFESSLNLKRKYFIQVNIGKEKQKGGINSEELDSFYDYCSRDLKLNIVGLMSIPPIDNNVSKYFKRLMELNHLLGLKELSMGMSGDYIEAIRYKATFLRIGSAIFGERNQ